jgi:uncharacterized membrane protein YeiH
MVEWIIYITDILGTIAFSASGAMIGIQRRLDLFGIVFLSVITSFGGGTIRDILLGHFPPRMFYNFEFLAVAVVVSIAVFILTYVNKVKVEKHVDTFEFIKNLIDAVGLAAFSIAGVEITMAAGYSDNVVLCILMGMTTGVGGGILRDTMTRTVPYVFIKHVYAMASLVGSLLFYILIRLNVNNTASMLISIGFIVVVRLLAAKYKWSLPRIHSNKEEKYE